MHPLTFFDEFVFSEESLVGSLGDDVGLEDELNPAVDGDHGLRGDLAAEPVLRVLHPERVDREHIHVVEQASASNRENILKKIKSRTTHTFLGSLILRYTDHILGLIPFLSRICKE